MNNRSSLCLALLGILFSSTQLFAQSQNNRPKLNQLGFYPEAPKLAITPQSEATSYHIRDAETGSVVYHGNLNPGGSYSLSGETVKIANFSSFKTPGSYELYIDGGARSYEFEIGNKVFDGLSSGLIKALYFNRVSVPLLEEHAGAWARTAGHPDDEVIIHPSAATESRPAGSTISSPGGWYDAGDFNKYVVPISSSISHMLFAYEQFPEYYNERELNIPESGDEIPDILDEAAFALRWLITMQDPGDGGVYNKLTHAGFQGTIMPHQASANRYVVQKGTAATLDFAAVMAQAARVYEPFLPDFADSALAAAEYAWEWAEANPNLPYNQGTMNNDYDPDISTGGYGDNSFSDEWFWAASELYITTGNDDYYDDGGWSGVSLSGWGNVQALGLFSLLHHRQNLTAVGLEDTSAMKQALVNGFDWYVNSGNNSPYRSPFGIQSWQFGWGSNGGAGNLGMSLFMLYQTTGDSKYYKSALHTLDYLLGRNAVGYSYVTGFGDQSPMNIHHRQSEADNVADPVPGWVAGGANPGQQDNCSYSVPQGTEMAALSYSDTYCSYASNEITTYWNSPFIYLTAALEYRTQDVEIESNPISFEPFANKDTLFDPGQEVPIAWTTDGISQVDVLYRMFSDEEFTEIETGIDASQVSECEGCLSVPNAPGDSLIVRIQDSSNPEVWTQSPMIKIRPAKAITGLTVEAQTTFQAGNRIYISWGSIQVDSVDLLYRLHFEEEFTLVDSGLEPSRNNYNLFRIPEAPGDSLIIRVRDSAVDSVFSDSDPIYIESSVSKEEEEGLPNHFVLEQNYPNPFNPTTQIEFNLPGSEFTNLSVYDMNGRLIATLVNEVKAAGSYTVRFDASNLSSGVYIYKLSAGEFTSVQKMILIK